MFVRYITSSAYLALGLLNDSRGASALPKFMGVIVKLPSVLVSSVLSLFVIGGLSSLGAQPLQVDKTSLSFFGQSGGSAVSQTLAVSSATSGLAFTAQSNASWLKVSPASGSTPSTLTVTADPTGLGAGTV